MDDNVTAQADFLGNFAVALIVIWIAGAAFFAVGLWRNGQMAQGVAISQAGETAVPAAQ